MVGTFNHAQPQHALRRFGFSEAAFLDAMRQRSMTIAMNFWRKNRNSILVRTTDRGGKLCVRSVSRPVRSACFCVLFGRDVLEHQAATIAASLQPRSSRWNYFRKQIHVDLNQPLAAVYDAIALGWLSKGIPRLVVALFISQHWLHLHICSLPGFYLTRLSRSPVSLSSDSVCGNTLSEE
jgi:hypothetical protein